MDKRAQGLPITTVILAILGIVVLVILFAILTGRLTIFAGVANECPGRCAGEAPGLVPPAVCGQFERKLPGNFISQNRDANNNVIPCTACCQPLA